MENAKSKTKSKTNKNDLNLHEICYLQIIHWKIQIKSEFFVYVFLTKRRRKLKQTKNSSWDGKKQTLKS